MKKQAFLFSAGEYLDSVSFPKPKLDLSGVKYDIQAMEVRLQQIGFTIVKKENAEKADYLPTFSKHTDRCPTDAINIVYFSGHGGHHNGNNYIFPSDFTTLFDSTGEVDESGINIKDIISAFKGKGRLILILDACRNDIGGSKGYYSEMTSAENVYIAYGACFGNSSVGVKNSLSWFTEAICDEILASNIDIDELFTNVRQNISTKHQKQLPSSVNSLLEKVSLHSPFEYDSLDKQVYDFIEKYGDKYNEKHGYFKGEELVFIDAAQYFNIGLLDAYWFYTKVQNKLAEEKGIKMPQVSEAEQKIISFMNLQKGEKHFSFDISHTWYYNGRQIRMGEIPPLPHSMQRKPPELGKEFEVLISAKKDGDTITIFTNLPDDCQISLWYTGSKCLKKHIIFSGKIIINDAKQITRLIIDSNIFNETINTIELFGEKQRNLVGSFVKYHPIYGNYLYYQFDFD